MAPNLYENADNTDWSMRLRALLPGFDTAPSVIEKGTSARRMASNNPSDPRILIPNTSEAGAQQLQEVALPTVPHMFTQRIDALPDAAFDLMLAEVQRSSNAQSSSASRLSKQQLAAPTAPAIREELRKLLRQRRDEEMAGDAETADYSDEPYDSIARHVELQWRTYALLYPEEVARDEKLAMMVKPRGNTALPANTHMSLRPSADPHAMPQPAQPGVAGAAAELHPQQASSDGFGGLLNRLFGGGGLTTSAGGVALAGGVIPTAGDLQTSLLNLTKGRAPDSAASSDAAGVTGSSAAVAGRAAAADQAADSKTPVDASEPGPQTRGSPDASRISARTTSSQTAVAGRQRGRVMYERDPTYQRLRASLEYWYGTHAESLRPLQGGRVAKVHALWGAGLPADWQSSMRPAAAGRPSLSYAAAQVPGIGRAADTGTWGPLRWVASAVGAVGGVLGLRQRPRVWVVDGGESIPADGRGSSNARDGGGEVRGSKRISVDQARRSGRANASGVVDVRTATGGGLGAAGAGDLRGLAAAQEAVLRGQFALRKTTLVAPEML